MKKLLVLCLIIVTLSVLCLTVGCGNDENWEYSYEKVSVSRQSNQLADSSIVDCRDKVILDLSDLDSNKEVAYKTSTGEIISKVKVKSYVVNKTQESNVVTVNIVVMFEKTYTDLSLDRLKNCGFVSTIYLKENVEDDWKIPSSGSPKETVIKSYIEVGGGFVKSYNFGATINDVEQERYFKLSIDGAVKKTN